MRFGFSQKRPAGPHGTRPDAAGLTGAVLGAPASAASRFRFAAPLAAPPPGFCSVAPGVVSLSEPPGAGRLGSVAVVVSPVEPLPALLVLEGVAGVLLPLLGVVESSLELPQPVRAQSRANTQGTATSAARSHSHRVRGAPAEYGCHLRAERRGVPRFSERFIVYSHCAIARTTHEYRCAGALCPSGFESTHGSRVTCEERVRYTTSSPAECSYSHSRAPGLDRVVCRAERAFNRNVRSGRLCPGRVANAGSSWPRAAASARWRGRERRARRVSP